MVWPIVKLGDISEVITKGTTPTSVGFKFIDKGINFVKVESIDLNGKFLSSKFASISDECNFALKRSQLKEDDILFSIAGALGRTALVTSDILPANTNQALAIIRIKQDIPINKRYLLLALSASVTKDQVEKHRGGVAQQNLSLGQLKSFEIPLPSTSDQKRIVTILDQTFADIEKARATAETNLKNARELFDSYLFSLLLPVCSSKSTQTLACLTELIVDCEHKTAPTQDEGFPSIRTPNIGKGRLILDNVRRVSEETYNLWTRRAVPLPGDLILAREAPAGNVGVIPEGELVCLGQRTVLIRPKVNIVNSQYLAHLLLHPIMQSRLLAHSTGATVQHVNMKDIRALKLSDLPCVSEQVDVVRSLHEVQCKVEWLEKIYLKKVQCLDELKESILQKAFTGELTKSKGIAA
jgi:type I restriction enzyme S subunit